MWIDIHSWRWKNSVANTLLSTSGLIWLFVLLITTCVLSFLLRHRLTISLSIYWRLKKNKEKWNRYNLSSNLIARNTVGKWERCTLLLHGIRRIFNSSNSDEKRLCNHFSMKNNRYSSCIYTESYRLLFNRSCAEVVFFKQESMFVSLLVFCVELHPWRKCERKSLMIVCYFLVTRMHTNMGA